MSYLHTKQINSTPMRRSSLVKRCIGPDNNYKSVKSVIKRKKTLSLQQLNKLRAVQQNRLEEMQRDEQKSARAERLRKRTLRR